MLLKRGRQEDWYFSVEFCTLRGREPTGLGQGRGVWDPRREYENYIKLTQATRVCCAHRELGLEIEKNRKQEEAEEKQSRCVGWENKTWDETLL